MEEINKTQKLMFKIMKRASFNEFDGKQVVADLIEHKDLWTGCMFIRDDLITLRDISDDHWNADTLYILTTGINDEKLERIALEDWGADEVSYLDKKEAEYSLGMFSCPHKVLRIWWD
jgi:hypothetical protein